jgi:protein kinase C substrate 80K-H
LDQKLRDFRVILIENGILADLSADGHESTAVVDARKRLKATQDELNTSRKSVDTHKEDLNKDYGPGDVFRALKGQCVSTDSGEYTYELCFMERTTQKPKKGGGNTGMGNFVRFEKIYVDEEITADGKGLGTGERIAMKHENGQHCWNGPNRSTTVILACAEKDEIWKIFEEEKCVYRMEVGTPAVCEAASSKVNNVRDEL